MKIEAFAMALDSRDGKELGLPDHTHLPSREGENVAPFPYRVPDHLDLPDSDDEMENPQELPQSLLLTDSLWTVLRRRHPDDQFFVGSNSGIYWKLADPPRRGAVAPDWFYIPDVPPAIIEGGRRRSYVMWKEHRFPLLVLEFVSGDGSEEHDRTPDKGKFWVYEHAVNARYYGILVVESGTIELYQNTGYGYELVPANERGHYPVAALGVELGIWRHRFFGQDLPWLRWWDDQGHLLMTNEERAEVEAQRAEEERQRAEEAQRRAEEERRRAEDAQQRAAVLSERLRQLGIDPDEI